MSSHDVSERRLLAILVADIAGYSQLMGEDENATVKSLRGHMAAVLPLIGDHGGRVVDTAGDGILAVFQSAVRAVECALAIQSAMGNRNVDEPADRQMQFRIGINLGDVIQEGGRVYGDGVNVAARLEALAARGGIVLSGSAFDQVDGKLECSFEAVGEKSLKNIERPVQIYRAVLPGNGGKQLSSGTWRRDVPSIAVLPFSNLSGDPEQEYFADGMVEDITTGLSQIRWLFVIARNSSFVYKGKAIDVREVGRDLGVRYILEGGVQKAGQQLRITAKLVNASTGAQVWAERFDGGLDDVFDLQDQITERVVAAGGAQCPEVGDRALASKTPRQHGRL